MATFEGLSSIITTSAFSIAASEPSPPIAIPISALAKEGASFIPSPTNIEAFEPFIISSKELTLSSGKHPPL